MQENPRINQQDRQKITFPGSANPRRSPNSALPLHTQKQCTVRGSSWEFSSLSLSLITKGSWIYLWGEGCQASRQLSDASTPYISSKLSCSMHFNMQITVVLSSVVISRPWSRDSSALEFILSRSRSRDLMAQFLVLVSRPEGPSLGLGLET